MITGFAQLVADLEKCREDVAITQGLVESLQIGFAEGTTEPIARGDLPTAATRVTIDAHANIERDFPSEFPLARQVTKETSGDVHGADFSALAKHWPMAAEFDWDNYLRCSLIRMVRALSAVRQAKFEEGRVLDFGSFFGNFSLMFSRAGYQVQAADSYGEFGSALKPMADRLKNEKVEILDLGEVGYDLSGVRPESVDIVLSMSVIEHIAHTPRHMLEAVQSVLRPGGILVLETPNQAYLYNRLNLARGQSIHAPIRSQYVSAVPFKGHHREYTVDEVRWMVEQAGLGVERVDLFNYSVYQMPELKGRDILLHRLMEADPLKRELIMLTARKAGPAKRPAHRRSGKPAA
jgi:2-polyprenyl-3-methyl-5-hydroxy-6-metoxy-1,4-benzoquinol methylase